MLRADVFTITFRISLNQVLTLFLPGEIILLERARVIETESGRGDHSVSSVLMQFVAELSSQRSRRPCCFCSLGLHARKEKQTQNTWGVTLVTSQMWQEIRQMTINWKGSANWVSCLHYEKVLLQVFANILKIRWIFFCHVDVCSLQVL